MTFYKVLDDQGRSCRGGDCVWSLPTKRDDGTWEPGEWMPAIEGELVPCDNGYHLTETIEQVLIWLGPTIYEAEPQSGTEFCREEDKLVVRSVRLLRKCEGWNRATQFGLALDFENHIRPEGAQFPTVDSFVEWFHTTKMWLPPRPWDTNRIISMIWTISAGAIAQAGKAAAQEKNYAQSGPGWMRIWTEAITRERAWQVDRLAERLAT